MLSTLFHCVSPLHAFFLAPIYFLALAPAKQAIGSLQVSLFFHFFQPLKCRFLYHFGINFLFDDIFVYAFPLQVYFVDYLKRCKNYGVTDIVSILPELFSYF